MVLPLLFFSSGCGGDKIRGEHPVYPASGVITYKGNPLAGARVVFYHEDSAKPPARATTDDVGKFTLTTYNPKDGAVPGKYTVTVHKMEGTNLGEDEVIDPKVGAKIQARSAIPPRYGVKAQSGLTAQITEDGLNEFKFDLK